MKKRILAFLLSVAMVVTSAVPALAAETDTLTNQVLSLSFEENLEDTSGKGNNGTMTGTETYVEGVVGKALQFNGKSYVDLGTSTDLQPENLTVSFWLKPSSTMVGEQMITWNKNEWYTDGWYLSSLNDNAPLVASIGPAATGGQPYQIQVPGNRAEFFPAGEWTHVAVTYNSATKDVKFYRNGVECATTIVYSISGAATGVLGSDATMQKSLGWNGPKHNQTSLNVALDEYQLYNDTATAEEVIALYEAGGATFDKKAIAQADIDALGIPEEVRSNISLPKTGASGSVITWESSDEAVISVEGKVTRPAEGAEDVEVTLTATAVYEGGEAVEKAFKVIVKAQEPAKEITLEPTSVMGDVTLVDDYLANAAQKEADYLLSMDSEKFLYEFYKVAGLTPTTSSGYGGWERTGASNFRGHTFGHYMSALSQAYLSSDNEEEKELMMEEMTEAVEGLLACQEAYAAKYPDHVGYISAFPQGVLRRVDGVASPTADDGTVLVPYYNLHKVLAGLIDISKNVDDKYVQSVALEVAEGFGEFLYNRMIKLTNKNAMLSIEYGGMNEALYELYNLTGNDHYKIAAQYFDETNLFTQLSNNQDVLNGKHANTQIPKFTGALKRYTVLTQNDEYYDALTEAEQSELDMYLEAAVNFWDIVVEHHTYVTGGNSWAEHFREADKLGEYATKGSYDAALTCETCNTYNMLKLTKELFKLTKDKKYMDYFETTYINAILSSQNPETGTTMYFQPMAPGYNKVFNRPHDEFWCCTGTGMENFSKLGDNIYYTDGNDVYVHMFFSSEYTDAENNLTLVQTANMPNEDIVTFEVKAADGKEVKEGTTLRLRKPDWLADEATIEVNGEEIVLDEVDGYYVIEDIKAGDSISYTMPMEVVVYDMPDKANMVAFKYGPVVLSCGLGTDNIERSAANGILVRVGTLDEDAKTTIYMENYTDIEDWKADVADNLVRIEDSEDGQVQFKLQNTDSPELTYTPHYMRYKESYGLYMYLEAADSEAAQQHILEEKEKLRIEEMSLDSLYSFDNNNYEFEKNLQASANSSASSYGGRQLRHAEGGGWFSYDMIVDPEAEHNYLHVDLYSGDRSRTFSISVNDEVIDTTPFSDAPGGNQFFTHTVEIPEDLVWEADEENKVTIKFASINGSMVGGVFGISTSNTLDYATDATMKSLSFKEGTLSPEFSEDETNYMVEVPSYFDAVTMNAVPNVGSGLIYVDGILINDANPRKVALDGEETIVEIVSKAQDHKTEEVYTVTIVKVDVELPYDDVTESDWYYDAVFQNYIAGTMTGMDDKTFAPGGKIVRGQFASIIHRLAGEEKVEFTSEFPDVTADDWFMQPVLWAKANKVVSGYSDGTFGANNNIVREQIAIMLHNYATFMGYDTTAAADLSAFGDAGEVSSWAVPAMQWAVGSGIISGTKEGNLAPLADATRAECAAMISNFMTVYGI